MDQPAFTFARDELDFAPTVQPSDDAILLERATPFYWSQQCVEVVTSVADAVDLEQIICHRELLWCDTGFCWFEKPWLTIKTESSGSSPMVALLWAWVRLHKGQGPEALVLTAFVQTTPLGPTSVIWTTVESGQPLARNMRATGDGPHDVSPDDPDFQSEMTAMLGFVGIASTFLRQKLLAVHQQPVERHARKRLPAEWTDSEAAVSVVQLRARESVPAQDGSVDVEVEWSHRWIVRGHMRQQWYPSLQAHLPLWIHPHLKGPDDKPLKPRNTPVFAVTR